MNDTPRKPTVTLEDLLRVKRAERPPAAFWDEFERGMRTKQLAAIVEPRPWWAPFIRVGAKFTRYQLPVGAAAILAITFVSLREYRTMNVAPAFGPAITAVATAPVVSPDLTKSLAAESINAPIAADVLMAVEDSSTRSPAMAEIPVEQAPAVAAMVGASSHVVPVAVEPTPSARYIAENLAAARADHPGLDRVLSGAAHSIDPLASRVEPLAQVNVPGQSRRARLLGGNAWFASTGSNNESSLRTDDQSSSRLTERRLSESEISRIDVGGSRLTVKF